MNKWIETKEVLPSNNKIVETKVVDKRGDHSIINLARHKHLWFNVDKSMYVYYTPTHWKKIIRLKK